MRASEGDAAEAERRRKMKAAEEGSRIWERFFADRRRSRGDAVRIVQEAAALDAAVLHGPVFAAAQRIQADYLVTSDKRLARSAPVACLDVPDMLALLQAAKVDGDGGDTLPTGSKYF